MPAFAMPRFPRFTARRRAAVVAAASAGLLVTGILSVGSAQAAPSTKYYTATISPAAVDASVSGQTFTLTLTNCAKKTTGCTQASQQTLGSANIQVPAGFTSVSVSPSVTVSPGSATGWSVTLVNGVIELRSDNTTDLNPGQLLDIAVTADTPATGAYTWTTQVKQSNDFSGTGNDFTLSGSQPQVLVGFPDHLAFVTQPSTVQASTNSSPSYMAPAPSVQVVQADGQPVTVGTAQVSLAADTAYGNPGLGGNTGVAAVNGLATFANLTASNLGGGYQLGATAIWSYGNYQVSLATTQDSAAFDVVQVLTTCAVTGCSVTTSGSHTTVNVSAGKSLATNPGTDQLEIAVGIDSLLNCLPFTPPNGLQVTRVVLDNRDKSITLTFDKYLVNQVPNNGTPLFTICFAAPGTSSSSDPWAGWITASGVGPTFIPDTDNPDTGNWVGILPDCTAANLPQGNPCVQSRSKRAANEIVTVSVPYQSGRADPKLW